MISKQPSLKQQFHRAHTLITAQKYKEARKLLCQIDHPKAQEWLAQLDDKQKQSTPSTLFSSKMILFSAGSTLLIFGVILAFLYVPTLLDAMQPNPSEQFLIEDVVVTDEEMLYSHVALYCYQITGYGGSDLCLDWTDSVMADYPSVAQECFKPYTDKASLEEEDYIDISNCFAESDVPEPL